VRVARPLYEISPPLFRTEPFFPWSTKRHEVCALSSKASAGSRQNCRSRSSFDFRPATLFTTFPFLFRVAITGVRESPASPRCSWFIWRDCDRSAPLDFPLDPLSRLVVPSPPTFPGFPLHPGGRILAPNRNPGCPAPLFGRGFLVLAIGQASVPICSVRAVVTYLFRSLFLVRDGIVFSKYLTTMGPLPEASCMWRSVPFFLWVPLAAGVYGSF